MKEFSQEYLWVGKLDKNQKELIFSPNDSHEPPRNHNLLLKRIVLGPCKDGNDLNVLNIETTKSACKKDDLVSGVLCCLQASEDKKYDQCSLDLLIPNGNVKFFLTEGRGPVTIFGQHIAEFVEYDGEESEDEEEEEEEEEDEEEDDEEVKTKKRKWAKSPHVIKKHGIQKMDQGNAKEYGIQKIDQGNVKEDVGDNEYEEASPAKTKKIKAVKAQKEIKAKTGTKGDLKRAK